MYSWIASWVSTPTTSEESTQESLYVDNNEQQKDSAVSDEWTWIEVIEDKKKNTTIFIQTNEQGPSIINERDERRLKRQKRKGLLAERIFLNSLYIDEPLFKKPIQMKRPIIKRTQSLLIENSLQMITKRASSISEVLSSTFPGQPTMDIFSEFDLLSLLEKQPVFKRIIMIELRKDDETLLNGIQHLCDTKLFPIRNAQFSIEWKPRQQSIAWKTNQQSIEWKKTLAITWRETKTTATNAEIKWRVEEPIREKQVEKVITALHTKHYVPIWMKKIKTFSKDKIEQNVPVWLQNIDMNLFNDTKPFVPDVQHFVVPEWLRNINIDIDQYNKLPSWLGRIDVCETPKLEMREEISNITLCPSWMQRIDVFEDGNENTESSVLTCSNVTKQNERRSSWIQWEDVEIIFQAGLTESNSFSRPVTTTQMHTVRSIKSLCESVMNIAVIVAACEVCVTNNDNVTPKSNTKVSRKRHNASILSPRALKRKMKYSLKTNKGSQQRRNHGVSKVNRHQKRSPQTFSKMGGIRAC